jgi:hypothetical protein
MMSPEMAQRYRRMTSSERLRLTLEMIRGATPFLLRGTPQQVDHRFELLRLENDARYRSMLEGIARTRKNE